MPHIIVRGTWFVVLLLAISCQNTNRESPKSNKKSAPTTVKNIVVLIGDGMGPQAVGLLNTLAKYGKETPFDSDRTTAFERAVADGTLGMVYHEPHQRLVTDSAASATQMASGKWSLSETIGIDQNGEPVATILDRAKQLGKATGLVSDTRLTHATPAAFAAHQLHRSKENDIAVELIEDGADVMLSGGLRHFLPASVSTNAALRKELAALVGGKIPLNTKRTDERNLLKEAVDNGYGLVFNQKDLKQFNGTKVLGLFASSGFPYRIDFDVNQPQRVVPTLAEMAQAALNTLSKNKKGFFLMVESGIIDWAAHDNDVGALLHEMIRFDETLRALYDFVSKRADTLLIVTADHETGGFGFSYSRRGIPSGIPFPGSRYPGRVYKPNYNFGAHEIIDRIFAQKKSFSRIFKQFDEMLPEQKRGDNGASALASLVNSSTSFPITDRQAKRVLEVEPNAFRVEGHGELDRPTFPKVDDFEAFYVYGDDVRRDILARIVAEQQNVVWSTGTHTSTPVPLIALGIPDVAKRFGRLMHSTNWAGELMSLWN